MNCEQVTKFLADYLDGTLPRRARILFKLHLLLCRQCRRYLASYVQTVRVTEMLGRLEEPIEKEIPDRLMQAILQARRGHQHANAPPNDHCR